MGHESAFTSLLLIMLLAVAVPFLASRIRAFPLPIIVGEILAGMIIGKSGFDLVQPMPTLDFLAEFGFTFLMFTSGLEVSFGTLFSTSTNGDKKPRRDGPVQFAFIYFLLTVAMAIGIGFGLTYAGLARNPLLMGLILSTTSLGIVVPILKEREMMNTVYGQTLLVSALVSDFLTLLLLSFIIAVISKGITLDLLMFLVLLAAFIVSARISQRMKHLPVLPRILEELSHATAQIRVRGAFALMVIWVVLAESLGVEVILGAFLAGAILSAGSPGHQSSLRDNLDAIGYGFFIPIFFITVGAQFDLGALMGSRTNLLLAPFLIVAAYLVKIVPALIYKRLFSWRETFAAGALLSSRLSLIIAASAIALKLDIITTATNSNIILVAIFTCTFSPLLFSRILPPVAAKRRRGVVILGTEQLAILLGQRLLQSGEEITFIGYDQAQLNNLKESGISVAAGDPATEEVLERAGMENARALIAVTNASNNIAHICNLARARYGVPEIIARADEPQLVAKLQSLKVRVVQPTMATAVAIEGALLFPSAFDMIVDKDDGVDLADVTLETPEFTGRPLRRVRLPGNALVLGIHRKGEIVVPHGDTVLKRRDTLLLVGSPDALKEARSLLNGRQ